MELTLQREDGEHTVTLTPVLSCTDGTYKSGLVDSGQRRRHRHRHLPQRGHRNLCRVWATPSPMPDTGTILPVESGEVCPVTIHSITKGTAGEPGELDGVFASNIPLGRDSAEQSNRGVRHPDRYGFGRDGTGGAGV